MCDCNKFKVVRSFPYEWSREAKAFLKTALVCSCGHLQREHIINYNGDSCLGTSEGNAHNEDSNLGVI
jgi:hypothetical protein